MELLTIPAGPIGTNAWLLINDKNEAILFDAPPQSYHKIKREAERHDCTIKALFITHGHWDHMLDTALFAADGIPVYAHKDGQEYMEYPEQMSDFAMPGLNWTGSRISNPVVNDEKISLCGIDLEVRTAPGHCPGSILVYVKDINSAITGDVIFDGSIGRTDLPGGSFEVLEKEIRTKVYTLPDTTVLCPGHGGTTTVDKEKRTNPYVRA
jgi:glyoxylase-like metal-dependent hydrolase (beta-lactamase superfamily II)